MVITLPGSKGLSRVPGWGRSNGLRASRALDTGDPTQAETTGQRYPDQGAPTLVLDRRPDDFDLSVRIWNDERKVLHGWVGPKAMVGETHVVADLPRSGAD